jgi:hypothetical protein
MYRLSCEFSSKVIRPLRRKADSVVFTERSWRKYICSRVKSYCRPIDSGRSKLHLIRDFCNLCLCLATRYRLLDNRCLCSRNSYRLLNIHDRDLGIVCKTLGYPFNYRCVKTITLVEPVLGIKCVVFLLMTFDANNFYCDVLLEMRVVIRVKRPLFLPDFNQDLERVDKS